MHLSAEPRTLTLSCRFFHCLFLLLKDWVSYANHSWTQTQINKSYIFPSILQTENIHRYSRLLQQTPPDVIKVIQLFNYLILFPFRSPLTVLVKVSSTSFSFSWIFPILSLICGRRGFFCYCTFYTVCMNETFVLLRFCFKLV